VSRPWENGLPKLDAKTARQIYLRCWSGERMSLIMEEYGISKNSVSNIKQGRTWRDATADLRRARGVDESSIVTNTERVRKYRQRARLAK
jgi:hypothetical protein